MWFGRCLNSVSPIYCMLSKSSGGVCLWPCSATIIFFFLPPSSVASFTQLPFKADVQLEGPSEVTVTA